MPMPTCASILPMGDVVEMQTDLIPWKIVKTLAQVMYCRELSDNTSAVGCILVDIISCATVLLRVQVVLLLSIDTERERYITSPILCLNMSLIFDIQMKSMVFLVLAIFGIISFKSGNRFA